MLSQQSGSLTGKCCGGDAPTRSSPRKGWQIVGGALSLAAFVLMPKCPLCLAAHVAIWTGVGLSFTEASYLREAILFASAAFLLYLFVKRARVMARAGDR